MFSRRPFESPTPTWTAMSEPKSTSPSDMDQHEDEDETIKKKKRKSFANSSGSSHRQSDAKRPKLDNNGRGDIRAGPSNVKRVVNHGPSSIISPAIRPSSKNAVASPSKPSSSISMSSQRGNVSTVNAIARKSTGSKPRMRSHISEMQGRGDSEISRASSSRSENSHDYSRTKLVRRTREEKERRRKSGLSSDEEDQSLNTGDTSERGDTQDKSKGKTTSTKDGPRRPSASVLATSISAPTGSRNGRRSSSEGDLVVLSDNDTVTMGGRIANKPKVTRKPMTKPDVVVISSSDDDRPPSPKKKSKRRDSQAIAGPSEVIEIFDSDESPPSVQKNSKGKQKETAFPNPVDDNEWDLDANIGMNDNSIPSPPPPSSPPPPISSASAPRPRAASLDKDYEIPRLAGVSKAAIEEKGKKGKKGKGEMGMEGDNGDMDSSPEVRIRTPAGLDVDIGGDERVGKVRKTKEIRASDAESASNAKRKSVSLPRPWSSASVSEPESIIPKAPSRPSTAVPAPSLPSSKPANTPPSHPEDPDSSLPHEPDTHDTDASESYESQIAAFREQMAQAFKTSGYANARKRSSPEDTRSVPIVHARRSARKRVSGAPLKANAIVKAKASLGSDSEDENLGESSIPASGLSRPKEDAVVENESESDEVEGKSAGVRIPPPVKPSSGSRAAASLNPLTSPRFEGKRRSSYPNPLTASASNPLPRMRRQGETLTKSSLFSPASDSKSYARAGLRSSNPSSRSGSAGRARDHAEYTSDGETASLTPKIQPKSETETPIRIPKPIPRKSARADRNDVAEAIEAAFKHNDNITVEATGKDDDPIDLTSLTDNDDEPMANAPAAAEALKEFFSFDSPVQDEQGQAPVHHDGGVPMVDALSHSREGTDELNIHENLMDQDVKEETASPERPFSRIKQSSLKEDHLPLNTQNLHVKESPSKQDGRASSSLFTPQKLPRPPVLNGPTDASSIESQVDDLSQEISALPLEESIKLSNGNVDSTGHATTSAPVMVEELFPELEYVDVPIRDDASGSDPAPSGLASSKSVASSSGSDSEQMVVRTLTHEMAEDSPQDEHVPPTTAIVTHEPELQVPVTEEELTGRPARSRSNSSPPPSSPPIALRRRPRKVRSTSRGYAEDDFNSAASSSITPPRSTTPDEHANSPPRQFAGMGVLTWEHYRRELRHITPEYFEARHLPHKMHDHINALDSFTRDYPTMRSLFETMMLENTADDEPDAPRITVHNEVDDQATPPWEFYYTNRMWLGEGVPPPSRKSLGSCDCVGKCDLKSKKCKCLKRQEAATGEYTHGFLYDGQGLLRVAGIPIYECNSLCSCGDECKNRVVGNGRKVQVRIEKTKEKGWGVFAGPKKIPKGSFIGIYAGELITDEEAEERGEKYNKFGRTYLFDIDFYHIKKELEADEDSVRYCVDAYHAGNFTRFLNHSCDPNCGLTPVYIDEDDVAKPLLVIFARRDIDPYDELTFSYFGNVDDEDGEEEQDEHPAPPSSPSASKALQGKGANAVYANCRCGARNCKGEIFRRD